MAKFSKKFPKEKSSGWAGPAFSAVVAGSVLASAAFLAKTSYAIQLTPSGTLSQASNVYQSVSGPSGFLSAGTKDKTKTIRLAQAAQAQGYYGYYCYYYGVDCCDPNTAEGRDACCYYYGTYCETPPSAGGAFKPDDEYNPAGFAGTGSRRENALPLNPLF